jgi:hypothetical protein
MIKELSVLSSCKIREVGHITIYKKDPVFTESFSLSMLCIN